ncbi:MAG: hypothetical protein ACYTFY_19340 [Planctomycetota bacterium]|jgi:hypothetical protein
MKKQSVLLSTFLLVISSVIYANGVEGRIYHSDGSVQVGEISLSSKRSLKLHVKKKVVTLKLEQLRSLTFGLEREMLIKKWIQPEAGQARKEYSGKDYPVRYLKTVAQLSNGDKYTGHLYTTVFYISGEEGAEKLVVKSKIRGKAGQSLEELKYLKKIAFNNKFDSVPDLKSDTIPEELSESALSYAAVSVPELIKYSVAKKQDLSLSLPSGERYIRAVQYKGSLFVGCSSEIKPEYEKSIREGLSNMNDFFDTFTLIGVIDDSDNGYVYSVQMMTRSKKTTLRKEKSQPWRLDIMRWIIEPETGRLMIAGRETFFRGIVGKDEKFPLVSAEKLLISKENEK